MWLSHWGNLLPSPNTHWRLASIRARPLDALHQAGITRGGGPCPRGKFQANSTRSSHPRLDRAQNRHPPFSGAKYRRQHQMAPRGRKPCQTIRAGIRRHCRHAGPSQPASSSTLRPTPCRHDLLRVTGHGDAQGLPEVSPSSVDSCTHRSGVSWHAAEAAQWRRCRGVTSRSPSLRSANHQHTPAAVGVGTPMGPKHGRAAAADSTSGVPGTANPLRGIHRREPTRRLIARRRATDFSNGAARCGWSGSVQDQALSVFRLLTWG